MAYHWHPDITKPDEINTMRLGSAIPEKEPGSQEQWMEFWRDNQNTHWLNFTKEEYESLPPEAQKLCNDVDTCPHKHIAESGTLKIEDWRNQ